MIKPHTVAVHTLIQSLLYRQAVECAKPMAMDAADLGEYLHGPRLDMVKAYLEQTRLTYQQQVEIRDCLIVTVNILNMKRAGDVPHLRMSELDSAVVPEEDDGKDIEIHVSYTPNLVSHSYIKKAKTEAYYRNKLSTCLKADNMLYLHN